MITRLKEDPVFRYSCAFDIPGNFPSESTLSRFLDKLSNTEELKNLFHDLVVKAKELGIIDGDHISID